MIHRWQVEVVSFIDGWPPRWWRLWLNGEENDAARWLVCCLAAGGDWWLVFWPFIVVKAVLVAGLSAFGWRTEGVRHYLACVKSVGWSENRWSSPIGGWPEMVVVPDLGWFTMVRWLGGWPLLVAPVVYPLFQRERQKGGIFRVRVVFEGDTGRRWLVSNELQHWLFVDGATTGRGRVVCRRRL